MDHQAFAQLLGSYGEFIGTISVVVTLVYLSIQVRQNTKLAMVQLNNSAIEGYARFREQQNQHPLIVVKMQRGAELTEEEDVIAVNLISEALFASAIAFENSRQLERSDAAKYITTAAGILRRHNWPLGRNAPLLEAVGLRTTWPSLHGCKNAGDSSDQFSPRPKSVPVPSLTSPLA